MVGISPEKLLVLLALGFVLLGPEKIPELARQAAQLLRTLRDLAHGARTQLTTELGPDFANFDLNSLNPKTAIRTALLDDGEELSSYNPFDALQRALRGPDDAPTPPTLSAAPDGATGPTPFDPDAT